MTANMQFVGIVLYVVAMFMAGVATAWLTERWRKAQGPEDEE
jgi:cbb3-type cytochrome oxidase subunit 1